MSSNKKSILKIAKIIMPLLLSLMIFLMICPVAMYLPVLGEGAQHAYIVKEIANKQSLDIETKVYYPMFYHIFGAVVYSLFGITGVKIIAPFMMTLSGLIVYLIAKELTKSEFVALLSIPLIAFSPKIIRYGAQILMEPFLVFFICAAFYSLMFFYKKQNGEGLIVSALLVAMAISAKQQGLFLFIAAPLFLIVNKVELKKILLFIILILLFAAGPYLFLVSSTGGLVKPDRSYLLHIQENPDLISRIIYVNNWNLIPEWSKKLEKESGGYELYKKGTIRFVANKFTLKDMLNKNNLVYINSLYPAPLFGYVKENLRTNVLEVLFLIGILITVIYSLKDPKWRGVLIVVLISWFFMFFSWGTLKHFLYLPVFLSFIYFLPIQLIIKRIKSNNSGVSSACALIFLLFIIVVALIPYSLGIKAQYYTKGLEKTQCYSRSKGGIASIEEVGLWIQRHSKESDKIFGTSEFEWVYYTNRKSSFDYRIYFLPKERIDYWLKFWGTRFVIIRQNQIIPDEKWDHWEYYPESFVKKIEEMYPLVYKSSYEDIMVYEVKCQNDK